jgi:hypothetical protein
MAFRSVYPSSQRLRSGIQQAGSWNERRKDANRRTVFKYCATLLYQTR